MDKDKKQSEILEEFLKSIKKKKLRFNNQLNRDKSSLDDISKTKEKYSVRYKVKPSKPKKDK